ncbi:hypothetical protein [Halovulum sp. GXIMD14793]
MNHNKLHSVAHNYAGSLAGGLSFVVPHHVMHTNVFAEAAATEDGYFVADFLTGRVDGAAPAGEVAYALPLFKDAFPAFCKKHNVDVSDYQTFRVRFIADSGENRFVVTVEDRNGRRSSREYIGTPSKRSETLDELGRRRPKVLDKPFERHAKNLNHLTLPEIKDFNALDDA